MDNRGVPADYEIDVARRLVHCRLWGEVTHAESTANRLRMASDPAFNPAFFELIDIRGVTGFGNVTSREVMDNARESTHFAPGTRRAVVATTEVGYGLARMWEAYRAAGPGTDEVEVFRSLEAAEEWLGLRQ
jgi:hypothetical protein